MDPATTATAAAAAAGAPPPASTTTSPRRSGRSRVSTTMQIQGHTVLRKNNYEVKGMTYVFDARGEDAPRPAAPPRPNKKPRTAGKPRQESPAEAQRRRHNRFVEDATERKFGLRKSFLADRLDVLRPFLDPSVADGLSAFRERHAGGRGDQRTEASVPVAQPKMIETAVLRPYQIRGLRFMVEMHEQNLAMILGDEMGLVRNRHAGGTGARARYFANAHRPDVPARCARCALFVF